ncbi:2'-5' RNA ligase family protein [Microbacteriaceae bacterium 4G12]
MQRSVLIFIKSDNLQDIEKIRQKHDPLYNLVPPHITLVFPFESEISNEQLKQHIIENIKGIDAFNIHADNVVTNHGEYLFLQIKEGKEKIITLHDRLYQGRLQPFLREDIPYVPHITVGRKNNELDALEVAKSIPPLKTKSLFMIHKITVESIGMNNESIIEFELLLL